MWRARLVLVYEYCLVIHCSSTKSIICTMSSLCWGEEKLGQVRVAHTSGACLGVLMCFSHSQCLLGSSAKLRQGGLCCLRLCFIVLAAPSLPVPCPCSRQILVRYVHSHFKYACFVAHEHVTLLAMFERCSYVLLSPSSPFSFHASPQNPVIPSAE